MEKKPKRRTRERIVETALRLFNQFGAPNVTTTVIADEYARAVRGEVDRYKDWVELA